MYFMNQLCDSLPSVLNKIIESVPFRNLNRNLIYKIIAVSSSPVLKCVIKLAP